MGLLSGCCRRFALLTLGYTSADFRNGYRVEAVDQFEPRRHRPDPTSSTEPCFQKQHQTQRF